MELTIYYSLALTGSAFSLAVWPGVGKFTTETHLYPHTT